MEDSDSEEDSDCELVGPKDGQEESSGHIVFDSASAGVSRGKSVKWQEEQVMQQFLIANVYLKFLAALSSSRSVVVRRTVGPGLF